MLFSIIAPIYNVSEYLEECILSVRSQNFEDYELILVDDGSTDECGNICKKYAALDLRIKYIFKENGGLTSARKAGIAIATGDYVVCLDGDDALAQGSLRNIADIIEMYKPDCICTNYENVVSCNSFELVANKVPVGLYEGKKLNLIWNHLFYCEDIKGNNGGLVLETIWTKVVKREIYASCQLSLSDRINLGEDIVLVSSIFKRIECVYFSDIISHRHNVRQNSLFHSFSFDGVESLINVILCVMKEMNKSNQAAILGNNLFLLKIARASKFLSYKDMKNEIIDAFKSKTEMYRFIRTAVIKNPTFKGRIRMFLIKNEFFYPLYFYYKYWGV